MASGHEYTSVIVCPLLITLLECLQSTMILHSSYFYNLLGSDITVVQMVLNEDLL